MPCWPRRQRASEGAKRWRASAASRACSSRAYTFSYDGCAVSQAEGPPVRKRVYRGLGLTDPVRPLVPNIRIAQERVVIELTRGCSNFCNFCHAGFYDLPYRCYDSQAAAERIDEIVRNTGYNEVTLSSLSISDYPKLAGLINRVLPGLTERGISVAFPSLRVDRETLPVIEQISEVRRASLTFAVESASDTIRARANKKVVLQDLVDIVKHVYGRGWKVIKLYFMIGLPGCEEQDEAEGIIELLKHIFTDRRKAAGHQRDRVALRAEAAYAVPARAPDGPRLFREHGAQHQARAPPLDQDQEP